jgi:hypothetical protein
MGFNFSVAVGVGYIALFGIAVETGLAMVIFLHEALDKRIATGALTNRDIEVATIEGDVNRPTEIARSLPQSACLLERRGVVVSIMGVIQIFARGSSSARGIGETRWRRHRLAAYLRDWRPVTRFACGRIRFSNGGARNSEAGRAANSCGRFAGFCRRTGWNRGSSQRQ